MNRDRRRCAARVAAGAWMAAVLSLGCAARALAQDAAPSGAKTLHRVPDPVVVTGEITPTLLGKKVEQLGLFALGAAGLAPIPFQVDEKTAAGAYVFPGGKEANPGDGNGLLDKQDELVFMADDSGSRLDAAAWPEGASDGAEIAVSDPVDGTSGFVYLFVFDAKAPRSKADYVSYDPAQERITAEHYTMQYTPGKDHIFFSNITIPTAAGGSGVNFVDRLKLRTYIKTKLLLSLSFDEEEWDSKVAAYFDGPVRAMRMVKNRLSFMGIEVSPTVQVFATYYRDFHQAPAKIQQTVDFPSIAKEAWFKLSVDLNEQGKGMKYYRPSPGAKDPWHVVDGVTSEDEKNLDPRRPNWHLLTGTPGTFLWFVEMPKPLAPVTDLTYTDDLTTEDDPENVPGSIGEVAFKFDLFPLEKGNYDMRLFYMYPEHWQPGDEKTWLTMIDKPLKPTATPLTKPAG